MTTDAKPPVKVSELMGTPPIFCSPTDTLEFAARLMWEKDVGAIIVLAAEASADGYAAIAVITDRDIAMAAYLGGFDLKTTPVSTAMSKELFSLWPEALVPVALALMAEKQVTQIPILTSDTNKTPVGLLSLWSIAANPEGQTVEAHQIVSTIAAVFKGRGH